MRQIPPHGPWLIDAYDATGEASVTGTAATLATDTVGQNTNSHVFSHSSGEITVNKTTRIMLGGQVTFKIIASDGAYGIKAWFEEDSTEIAGTQAYGGSD